jgi:ubiquinone/menaquinone biosynthesis C-methylase UbiE
MASIEQNKEWWNNLDWTEGGADWSSSFGTPDMQWYASLLPRIHTFVPTAQTILEIAPGFGRWTHFLKEFCEKLIVVDLSEKCIAGCRERFKSSSNIEYHVNDGQSLAMAPDGAIDFVFTFDSLVHVEKEVIAAYLHQIATKLKPDGVAFIHHSNLGSHLSHYAFAEALPRGRGLLSRWALVERSDHKRARSMTAEVFQALAANAGLRVISQELINWQTRRLIDCISIVTRPGSIWERDCQRFENAHFEDEAAQIKKLGRLYSGASFRRR